MLSSIFKFVSPIKKRFKKTKSKIFSFIDKKPLTSFFVGLFILIGLIIVSNLWPKETVEAELPVNTIKKVNVYRVGAVPTIKVEAQIKKSGVIQINAQVSGVVNYIHAFEGSKITKGMQLFSIGSNFYGGNVSSVSRQIAQKQHEEVEANYPAKKEILRKQKELAQRSDENSDELREITSRSLDDTKGLIALNEQILTTIDQNLSELLVDPITNRSDILAAQQLKSQYLSATNQAKSALRSAEQITDTAKTPTKIADLTRELATQQLEIQEKQLDLGKEVSKLQLVLSRISESLYYPSAPFAGVVERVLVKPFESVTPGNPLMIVSQVVEDDPITAIAYVSSEIAKKVSQSEMSTLYLGGEVLKSLPDYVSTEAVQGGLYAVYYSIPDSLNKQISDNGLISVEIPLGLPDSGTAFPFVPIDAIYQTEDKAYIFLLREGKAYSQEVRLGQLFGKYVQLADSMSEEELVIVDRNVIEGDLVESL